MVAFFVAALLNATSLTSAPSAAAPFEDVHGRFTVELPEGWQFAPIAGDTSGAAFRRDLEGLFALASVRAVQLGASASLEAFSRKVASALVKEPGYKQLAEELDTLAGVPAIRRKFVMSVGRDGKLLKMVEERVAVIGGTGFVVHVETVAEAFGTFEPDFAQLFASFVPKGVKAKSAAVVTSSIVGAWVMVGDNDAKLDLKPNGTFRMSGMSGTYRIDGNKLVTQVVGTGQETFAWELLEGDLILSSPAFDEPIRYRRAR